MTIAMKKGTILSVDDDENLQTVIAQYLEGEGYTVVTANNVATAMEKVDADGLDVVLLDLVLPDGEGLSLIPQFQAKCQAGIIIVSGKSDTTEKIICLEMGADDYLTKPFEMRELAARIKAVVRRTEAKRTQSSDKEGDATADKSDRIDLGDWVVDRAQYQVFDKDGQSLQFTTGEFQLLEALALSPNRALSRERLFDLTRDGEFDAYDRAIDIQIARIRKKMGDVDSQIIKTVRGVGYMFYKKSA